MGLLEDKEIKMDFSGMYDKIREDNLFARKNSITTTTVITGELIGKFQESIKSKKVETIDAINLIVKVKAEHIETRSFLEVDSSEYIKSSNYIEYCEFFLPSIITDEARILIYIKKAVCDMNLQSPITMKNMSTIIKEVRDKSGGAIDNKKLSILVKKYINT